MKACVPDGLPKKWVWKGYSKEEKLQAYFISNPQSSYFESPYFKSLLKIISTDHSSDPFFKTIQSIADPDKGKRKNLYDKQRRFLVKLHDQIKQYEE
ncbi:MAG: hypothetical protein IPN15_07030 [Saprospiraceae bacterium]|nr:hypothetical protein [Candidatus Vicinibacter affinis]